MADKLLDLVVAGQKTATCWPVHDGQQTYAGKRMVACDGRNVPRIVLETQSLERVRFDAVDADFAAAEGESDLSLAWWREAHRDYFTRNGGFRPDMMLWCERFEVVELLPIG